VSEVLEPAVAYLATDVLRGVISRGTGTAAGIGRPAAGKTGTTQKYRDAWFVGYTPDLVAAVWVGYPESQREMTDVHGRKVTGGSFPAEIWAAFMRKALEGREALDFTRGRRVWRTLSVCRESGELSTEWCTDTFQGLFLSSHKPGVVLDPHRARDGAAARAHRHDQGAGDRRVDRPRTPGRGDRGRDPRRVRGHRCSSGVPRQRHRGRGRFDSAHHRVDRSPAAASPDRVVHGVARRGLIDQPVTFDAAASKTSGTIVLYLWEFGDGTGGRGREGHPHLRRARHLRRSCSG
jgi:membrane peptidoglycan carboxypeptidase